MIESQSSAPLPCGTIQRPTARGARGNGNAICGRRAEPSRQIDLTKQQQQIKKKKIK